MPLVSYGESCVYHRLAAMVLKAAGLDWEDVFTGPSIASLDGAVAAGLGVMAISRARAMSLGMTIWDDAPLPKLPDLHGGVYVREGGARAALSNWPTKSPPCFGRRRPWRRDWSRPSTPRGPPTRRPEAGVR